MKAKFITIFLLLSSIFRSEAQTLTYINRPVVNLGSMHTDIQIYGIDFHLSTTFQDIGLYFFNNTDTIQSIENSGRYYPGGNADYINAYFNFNMCSPGLYSMAFNDSTGTQITIPDVITVQSITLCNAPVFTNPSTPVSNLSNVVFSWGAEPLATSYNIEFSEDSLFPEFRYTYFANSTTNSFQNKYALLNNHTYYMRVIAMIGNLASRWSNTIGVTINSTPSLVGITPTDTYQGEAFMPVLSGLNTYFHQASNTISYSLDQGGTTIPATFPAGDLEVNDDEEINSATFNIPINAPTGLYNVNFYDSIDGAMIIYNGVYIHESYQYSGKIYYDLNSNNIFDTGDIPFANASMNDGFRNYYADTSGNFSVYRPIGTYTVVPAPFNLNCFTSNPPDYTFTLDSGNPVQTGVDFALSSIPGVHDLSLSLSSLRAILRTGVQHTFYLNYSNLGPVAEDGTIKFLLPSGITIDSASNPNYTVNGDTVIWNFTNLQVFSSDRIIVYLNVPLSIPIGTVVNFYSSIENGISDIDTTNNTSLLPLVASNSFDPNLKAVSPETILSDLPNGQFLTYTIYFQNTGNDTAYDISILDTISTNLDFATLQVMSSSHDLVTLTYPQRAIEFRFDHINLVDSIHNEPMSHGFVTYRIKTISNLSVNDAILNTAYIYFDHNAFVMTNECNTITLGLDQASHLEKNLKIFPNPTTGKTKIRYFSDGVSKMSLVVIDQTGKTVKEINYPVMRSGEHELTIDISNLNSGSYNIITSDGRKRYSNTLIIEK